MTGALNWTSAENAPMNKEGESSIEQIGVESLATWLDLPELLFDFFCFHNPAANGTGEEFKRWFTKKHERVAEYLCFLDIGFFDPSDPRRARYALLTQTHSASKAYTEVVKDLIGYKGRSSHEIEQEACFSMALHRLFFTGLHAANGREIKERINGIYDHREGGGSDDRLPLGHKFHGLWLGIAADRHGPRDSAPHRPELHFGFYSGAGSEREGSSQEAASREEVARIQYAASQKPLRENLERYVQLLKREHCLTDAAGSPLRFVICLPLNAPVQPYGTSESRSRNVAQLFIGLAGREPERGEHDVMDYPDLDVMGYPGLQEMIRDFAMMMYLSNAASLGARVGTQQGLEAAQNAFGHQIRDIANAISDRWLVDPETWEKLDTRIAGYKIAPAPILYEAIRTALAVWAQTRRWEDLLFNQHRTLPKSLADLSEQAFRYARHLRIAMSSRKLDLSIPEDLEDLQERLSHMTTEYGALAYKEDDLNGIRLRPEPPEGSERMEFFTALCTMFRLLMAIFDNYMGRGLTDEPIELRVRLNDGELRMFEIAAINQKRPTLTAESSTVRPGRRGRDIIDELAWSLGGLTRWPQGAELHGDQPFTLVLTLPLSPLWDWK